MTDSSLEEDSRCPSNRIFCQPSSTVSNKCADTRDFGDLQYDLWNMWVISFTQNQYFIDTYITDLAIV